MDGLFPARDAGSDEDYYAVLGCDENSSVEQISTEFKQLARKYHPDKVSSEDRAAAERMFIRIGRAKETLLDKERRKKYDHWRSGGFNAVVNFEKWLDMQTRVHTSMHWAMPQKPVPSLPEATSKSDLHKQGPTVGGSTGGGVQSEASGVEAGHGIGPLSLVDFRKGGQGSSNLGKFRDYNN